MTPSKRAQALMLAAAVALAAPVASAQEAGGGIEQLLVPQAPGPAPAHQPAPVGLPPGVGAPQAGAAAIGPQAATGKNRRDANFENALKALAPVTPEQVREYRRQDDSLNRAMVSRSTRAAPSRGRSRSACAPGRCRRSCASSRASSRR